MMLVTLSLVIWLYLLLGHGNFWQEGPYLPKSAPKAALPVTIVVPARDEAETIEAVLRSLLAQDYAAPFRVVLVDDNSTDGTGDIARKIEDERLTIITGAERPEGWSGKLWAVSQGVAVADTPLILLTDADITHEPGHLASLVAAIETGRRDMVSEMVQLNCVSDAEKLLVPAFVYFFQMLYPVAWVNDSGMRTAAAAGGTILVRRSALDRIGGIAAVRGALIDDVALARAVKRGGRIFLGHSKLAVSLRPYPEPRDIWRMIERTAYVQLRYSPVRLVGCVLGLGLVWFVPPLALLFGGEKSRVIGLLAYLSFCISYMPTLNRFRLPFWYALGLPLIAAFYLGATISSAQRHHQGQGVAWKNRAYREAQ